MIVVDRDRDGAMVGRRGIIRRDIGRGEEGSLVEVPVGDRPGCELVHRVRRHENERYSAEIGVLLGERFARSDLPSGRDDEGCVAPVGQRRSLLTRRSHLHECGERHQEADHEPMAAHCSP